MPDTAAQRGFSDLIAQSLHPPKTDRQRTLPIVLLWGPKMSGKSEILDHIHEQFGDGMPYARRSREELGRLRPHEVALQLAFHLSSRVEGFGRLKFPRLLLGVAAIRGPIDIRDPATTRSMMIRRTFPDGRRLRRLLRETATGLSDVVGAGQGTRFFLGLAVEGIGALGETMLELRGPGRKWYRTGLGQYFADPVDALVRLAEQETNPQSREQVDEVLCRAFLADLRDEYSTRLLQLYDRATNCLAVLDDADTEAARRFLAIVAAQRQEWDPLLIVSAAASRSPSAGFRHPERWLVRNAGDASYQDWSDGRATNGGWAACYPVEVDGLSLDEARAHFTGHAPYSPGSEIEVADALGDQETALRFAHRLTDGHLGGMRLVLSAMSRESRLVGAENVDVRALFHAPATEDGTSSLAEQTRRLLVDGWPPEMHRALVRSSAARDFGEQSLAAVLEDESDEVAHMMRSFRSHDLWVRHSHEPDETDPPVLHPFPRRGVLHLLAEPQAPGDLTWAEVHRKLQAHAERWGDRIGAMYHRLALGGVTEVAEHLCTLFDESADTEAWYDILTAITAAPLARPEREADPQQHWLRLAKRTGDSSGEPARLVELVAALQLHTDPLGDPGHHLCIVIARELERLARQSRAFFFLLEKAEDFHVCWQRWHQD